MRAVVPIFFVIVGLGASEFAYSRIPGGLANADAADIAYLAREGVIAGLDQVYPEWRTKYDTRSTRQRYRKRSRHMEHRSRSAQFQTRLFIDRQRVSMFRQARPTRHLPQRSEATRIPSGILTTELQQPIEITFVVPTEERTEAGKRTRERRSRKNP